SGAADKIIDAESKILLDAGLQGLPTTYVGAQTILGAQPEEVFRDAFDRALRGEGERGIPALVYWPLVLALAAVISWVGRGRRHRDPSTRPVRGFQSATQDRPACPFGRLAAPGNHSRARQGRKGRASG